MQKAAHRQALDVALLAELNSSLQCLHALLVTKDGRLVLLSSPAAVTVHDHLHKAASVASKTLQLRDRNKLSAVGDDAGLKALVW